MKITRRDLLKLIGGGAVGTMVTPIPWKLLRDSSVWSQNWPGVPVPKTGEVTWRTSACTACPVGCGVKARCVNGEPVSLTGIPGDPVSGGALCALGLAAHHLSYHPARVRSAMKRDANGTLVPVDASSAMRAFAAEARKGTVAIFDSHPGRSLSAIYQEFITSLGAGYYLVPPSHTRSTARVLGSMFVTETGTFVPDLANARSILSFGAPLLDGWGSPAITARILGDRPVALTQIEPRLSRTAMHADSWVAITPGTEGIVALGLAHLLHASGAVSSSFFAGDVREFLDLLPQFSPDRVSTRAGVKEETLRQIAAGLNSSTIVIGGGDPVGGPLPREDEIAINALNLMLGNVGISGGYLRRTSARPDGARDITEIPDHSLSLLMIDDGSGLESIPWTVIRQKLADGATVVSFSPVNAGHSLQAGLFFPAAAPFETASETVSESCAPRRVLRISSPLRKPAAEVFDPVALLSTLLSELGRPPLGSGVKSTDEIILRNAESVFAAGRGSVFLAAEQRVVGIQSLATSEAFVAAISSGGCWFEDDVPKSGNLPRHRVPVCASWSLPPRQHSAEFPLTLIAAGPRESVLRAHSSPIMSKVFQESGVRQEAGTALVNPITLASCGLHSGDTAFVRTAAGTLPVTVKSDRRTPPGTIEAAFAALNTAPGRSTWRQADATIEKESRS